MKPIRSTYLLLALFATTGATCRQSQTGETSGQATASASAQSRVELVGINSNSLTPREHRDWSRYVSELLAPCPDVAVPIAQCVRDKRACDTCLPAAKFLLRQVQAGRTKQEAVEMFEARFSPETVKTIVIGGSPVTGPSDATVTIVEFADFECPACGQAAPLVEALKTKFGKQLRVVFKHFPLAAHAHAKLAAQAAFAAQKQGQFWPMHKVLFANQLQLTEADLLAYAKKLGLDVNKFRADMHAKEAKQRVSQEFDQGVSLGVTGTPTLYINGRKADLSMLGNPLTDLEEWIALEIKLAAKVPGATAKKKSAGAPKASAKPQTSKPKGPTQPAGG